MPLMEKSQARGTVELNVRQLTGLGTRGPAKQPKRDKHCIVLGQPSNPFFTDSTKQHSNGSLHGLRRLELPGSYILVSPVTEAS